MNSKRTKYSGITNAGSNMAHFLRCDEMDEYARRCMVDWTALLAKKTRGKSMLLRTQNNERSCLHKYARNNFLKFRIDTVYGPSKTHDCRERVLTVARERERERDGDVLRIVCDVGRYTQHARVVRCFHLRRAHRHTH